MISLSVGDVIAGYRLDELAGRGGMGMVFRATHIALERQGAVKLIAPELAANEEFRLRFQRESRLAASIDHPHVIPIFDAGDEQGQLYVAMRYVEGTDLGALIAAEPRNLAPQDAVELIGQVADALDAAHELGLVHRDVKPANVLLETRRSGYHAYLTDFGLVKAVGAATGVLTRTGHWLGTPDYAAPEQILGAEVDARTDVYALGCMLYQAIAGKPPFERDNDVAKMYAHLSVPPPNLSAARPGVSEGLDEVIRTALAKAPEERHRSAGEFVSAARRAIDAPPRGAGEAVALSSPPPTDAPVAERTPAPGAPSRPPREAERRPAPRWRRSLVGAAAVALLAGGATLALVVTGGDDGGPAPAAIPTGNLTSNPSFEQNTSGWDFFRSDIAREKASDAPDGENVARVTLVGSQGEYSIDDDPETVSSSRKGRSYTASAWVKATDANDGETVCISLRERLESGDGEFPFSDASVRASAQEYREIRVTHRASANGQTIGVHVFRAGGGVREGEGFLVDAIALTEGGGNAGSRNPECDA